MKVTTGILAVVSIGLAGIIGWQEWRIRNLGVRAEAAMIELQRLRAKDDFHDQALEFVTMVLKFEEKAREDRWRESPPLKPSR